MKNRELLFSYKVHLKMCDLILTEYYFTVRCGDIIILLYHEVYD